MLKVLLLLLLALAATTKIVYLTELFRHGARYPRTDIYDGNQTKPFHGQLTGVGMRQQYLLGSYLRKDYMNELGLDSYFNPSQVEVFADYSQRCVQSAYAHMAGWFPLGEGETIPSGLDPSLLKPPFQQMQSLVEQVSIEEPALEGGYQTVPIKLDKAFFIDCPREAQIIARRAEVIAARVLQLQAQKTAFIMRMKNMFNLSLQYTNLYGMAQLYDTVVCDLNLGRPMPPQFTEKDFLQLTFIQQYLMILVYSENVARVVSSPIAKSVVDKMQFVIAGKYNKKLTVYSGHDTNVAPMLSFMNMSNAECVMRKYRNQTVTGNCADPPPFASNIQWELHLKDSPSAEANPREASSYYVKVKYNGDYYQLCGTTSTQCDFTVFANRVQAHLVDYKKECGIK